MKHKPYRSIFYTVKVEILSSQLNLPHLQSNLSGMTLDFFIFIHMHIYTYKFRVLIVT